MAEQNVVEIVLRAIDESQATLENWSDNINTAVSKIDGVAEPLADFADNILKIDAAIIALAGSIAHLAINEFEDFNSKVVDMGVIIDATPAQVDTLSKSILQFAQSSDSAGASMDGITGAITTALSAGAEYNSVIDLVKVANYGALASSADLAETTQALVGILNAYGLASKDSATNTQNAERVIDALFVTTQGGAASMSELANQMGRIVATAAAAKVPIEVIGSAIASMTAEGMTAEGAFTNLQSLLTALLKPSDELKAALGGMSITTDGLPAIMDRLKTVTGGTADKMAGLFGSIEATKAALVLANDASGTFGQTLGMMADKTGKAAEKARELSTDAKAVAIDMQKAIDAFQVQLGADIDPGWVAIEAAIKNVFNALSQGVESGKLKVLTDAFNSAYFEIAKVIDAIAKNLPEALGKVDFNQLATAFKGLLGEGSSLFKNVFGDFDLNTADGVAAAIQKMVDGVELLLNAGKNILETWQPTTKALGAFADELLNSTDGAQDFAGKVLGYAQQFEAFKGLLTGSAAALELLAGSMGVIATLNLAGAVGGMVALGTAVATLAGAGAIIYGAWTAMDKWAGAVDEFGQNSTIAADASEKAWERQRAKFAEISQQTGVSISSFKDLFDAQKNGNIILDEATGKWITAKEGVRDFDAEVRKVAEANGALDGSLGDVSQKLDNLPALWAEIGKAVTGSTAATKDYDASILKIATSIGKFGQETETFSGSTALAAQQFANLAGVSDSTARAVAAIVEKGHEFQVVMDGNNTTVKDLTLSNKEHNKSLGDKGKEIAKTSEEMKHLNEMEKLAAEGANKLQLAMLELSGKKFKDLLDYKASINVAEIQAQTKQVEAAFNSINSVVGDLTDSISSLWGDVSKVSEWDKIDFINAAKRQEDRLDQELQKQGELIDSQIELNNAKKEALSKGDAMIKITGNGLEPELVAFMNKIIEKVQIAANAEGMNMLLAEAT